MVPPPPGEESQIILLPPGWQSYLSPQGRRYYVNTTTNGESRSGGGGGGGTLHQAPSGFLPSSGVYRPMLRLCLRKPTSGAVGDSCFPHGAGWWGSVPDGEGRPSGLGFISGNSQPPPASPSNPVSWSGASSQSGTSEGSQVNIWFKLSKPGLATVGSSGSVACANKTEASTNRGCRCGVSLI